MHKNNLPFAIGLLVTIALVGYGVFVPPMSAPGSSTERKETMEPAPPNADVASNAQEPPTFDGTDDLGVPYILIAPDGLALTKWRVVELEDGGINYEFTVSTPGKKFDSDLSVHVAYYASGGDEIAADGALYIDSIDDQDRATRSVSYDFDCKWGECAGIAERAQYYVVTFDVALTDFP